MASHSPTDLNVDGKPKLPKKPQAEQQPFVREAGLLERYHITRCKIGLDACIMTCATYTNSMGEQLQRLQVLNALRAVIQAHPALCVQVDLASGNVPRFVRLPMINVEDVVTFGDATQTLEENLTSELARPFMTGTGKPLWRLNVYDGKTLIFAFHHGIGDGGSGLSFHHAMLAALNQHSHYDDPSQIFTIPTPENLTMVPPIEKLTNVSVSFMKFCKTIYHAFAPPSWQSGFRSWTAHPVAPEAVPRTNIRLWKLEADSASALRGLCRQHNCTITSFLHTLAICVLSHVASTSPTSGMDKTKHKTIATSVPVSLRRFTGVSPHSICDHVSSHYTLAPIVRPTTAYPLTQSSFPWKDAAQFNKTLRRNLKKSREVIGTIRFIYSLGIGDNFFLDKMGQKRDAAFELSNVGSMSALDDSGNKPSNALWQVDDVYFGQQDATLGAAIKMNVAGSPSGAINVTYTWGPGAVDDELVVAFIQEVHDSIEKILLPE